MTWTGFYNNLTVGHVGGVCVGVLPMWLNVYVWTHGLLLLVE